MTGTQLNRLARRTLWAAALTTTITSALAADSNDKDITEWVVTGSRIARPNLESTVPVTVVTGEAIFETGNTSVGDLLNDMPALRSTFSQSNSSRFLGTAGLNLLDLRGLGTQRTLVLLNGRRHVGADILSNAVSPDTNTFPSELIDRIDIVTGGSSAVYGSDAIAGVVNFILKKDYEGFSLRGQAGQSKYHDAENYLGSAVWGTNFADGRGNVAVDLEVSTQNPVFGSDRPNIASVNSFVVVDSDPAGPYGSDNVPDRRFYNDIRSTTIANGGLLQFAPTGTRTPCGVDPLAAAYACTQIFQPDGSLVPQTGTRVGLAPSGSFLGGNGTTGREGDTYGVLPKLDRMNLNLIGHYSFSDALETFVEAKYVRTDSIRYGTPAFFQGSTIDANTERPRFDNPFLTTSAQASIQAARAAAGLAPATASTQLLLRRNLIDLGSRQENATRETTRFVLGLEGKVFDNWHYEASVNYGRFDESTRVLGNLDLQRFTLAMDATRDTSGNIVCRSKIDPSTANIFLDPADPYAAFATARLPGDISACVPLNPFGEGNITSAMRDYLIQDTTSIGKMDQFDVNAFISGDSGQWFSLPAGNIGLVLGAEYRTESVYFKADDLVASGLTFYNALPLLDPPSFEVKELFTEVRVPLVKDVVMLKELTLSTAARISDYNSNTGTVTAYNFGLDWAPINDLRFRGGIGHAIRAPNLTELYSEESQNFSAPPAINDPCSARNIGTGSATRAANCAAAGRPANYDYVYTASLELLSGGNKALKEETSDSITVGFVYQPTWVQGLSISVDYFDIDVKNNIDSPTAQQILNACYDASSLNNQFCGLFQRAGATGGPTGEIPFQVLEGSLHEILLNYSERTSSGVDIDAAYTLHFGNGDKLTSRLVYTYMLNRDNHLDPADPGRANQVLMELGDPKNAYNLDFGYTHNALTAGWTVRYLSKMVVSPNYEDTFSIQGRLPENADYAEKQFYPEVYYHNMRVGYDVMENVNLYGGIDNVFNREPPMGLTGVSEFSAIYDPRGRFFYVGAKVKIK